MAKRKAVAAPVPDPPAVTAINPGGNPAVPMVRQPGGGMLKRGGVHVNAGRKPDALRRAARAGLAEALPHVVKAATGTRGKMGERMRAAKLLYEIGLGAQVSMTDVRERLKKQAVVLFEELRGQPDTLARITERLRREVWR